MSTSLAIAFPAAIVLVIVLAVVSHWKRRRQGKRGYGTCQHESDVVVNYFRCLRKYADFSGRADRAEYWTFALTNGLIGFLFRIAGADWPGVAFAAVMLVPGLAAATRRLHDVGRSGWRLMLVLVPFVVVAVYGDMPMREVREMGWNEDLFTMVLVLSMCMLLVFGIWTLVLLLRKGAEGGPCDQGRQVGRAMDASDSEPIEMIPVGKDEIDLIAASEKRKLKNGCEQRVSKKFVVVLALILVAIVMACVYFGMSIREQFNVAAQAMYRDESKVNPMQEAAALSNSKREEVRNGNNASSGECCRDEP